MIRVIIVDDEIEIVEGLKNIISWEEYNCEIVGTATSGKLALELMKTQDVELIITDITMPAMNGFELIRAAREIKKDIRAILLTCHSNFDYAKEAIQLEVDEYLVKHLLDKDVLISTITKINNKIKEDKLKENKLYLANHLLDQNKVVLIEKFFSGILHGQYSNKDSLMVKAAQYKILLPEQHYRTIGIFIEDYPMSLEQGNIQEEELIKFIMLNILEELLIDVRMHQYVWTDNRGSLYFIQWSRMEKRTIEKHVIEKLEDFLENIQFLNLPLSIYITNKYYDIFELKDSIEKVNEMYQQAFYENEQIVEEKAASDKKIVKSSDYLPFCNNFINNLRDGNKIITIHALEQLLYTIEKNRYSPEIAKRILDNCIMEIRIEFRKQEIDLEEKILMPDTFLGYKKFLFQLTNTFLEKQEVMKLAPHRDEIVRVLSYIEHHINDRITCEEMASYVNLSRSYFSRLFKEEVGISFSDYVLSRKIEYAKEVLLNSDSTIQEVSERVGFDTVSNFYRMFKKIIGKTPKQIREKN